MKKNIWTEMTNKVANKKEAKNNREQFIKECIEAGWSKKDVERLRSILK